MNSAGRKAKAPRDGVTCSAILDLWGLLSFSLSAMASYHSPPRNFRSLFSNIRCHFRASQGTRPRIPRKLLKMRNGDERQPLEPLHHTPGYPDPRESRGLRCKSYKSAPV
ncbi:uncharacterized protein BO87DRAFT_173160 [Aspergillus neoniger CBS 115656]|uniref:Uncharacterized protein n=1 Tax=Aspergillus neoniger (strain CBS 115656) TaxID=1448310 RepID=A0A318YAY5_ASPNB|nr:hypothetical protein BO87DRAFT_173160 [Aspergillus neoniger CBS 115656]PYH29830.1 hypothetical protein BO87DRAFT_173160 [Aspergillus neoniger CBS 115656]